MRDAAQGDDVYDDCEDADDGAGFEAGKQVRTAHIVLGPRFDHADVDVARPMPARQPRSRARTVSTTLSRETYALV